MVRLTFSSSLAALLVLCACTAKHFDGTKGIPVPSGQCDKKIRELLSLRSSLPGANIRADIVVDTDKKRIVFEQFALLKRPDGGFFTSIKFSNPVLHLSVDGDDVTIFDPREGVYAAGKGFAQTSEKLVGISIGYRQLLEIFMGNAYIGEDMSIERCVMGDEGLLYAFIGREGQQGERMEMAVDPAKTLIRRLLISDSKEGSFEVLFSRFRTAGSLYYPYRITLRKQDPYVAVKIKIVKLKVGGQVGDDDLRIVIPKGTPVRKLESIQGLFDL